MKTKCEQHGENRCRQLDGRPLCADVYMIGWADNEAAQALCRLVDRESGPPCYTIDQLLRTLDFAVEVIRQSRMLKTHPTL